jgi:REP element-mobilizing transposase RayT
MPRQARLDAPGTLHHVIVRGIEKCRIVDDRMDRESFISRLGELAAETGTRIFSWALLTNHAHILLHSGNRGLSSFMRRLLTGYAMEYNRRQKRHGQLFQNRYKSIVCEEDAYFLELVRYIHLNPLRAGLVTDLNQLHRYQWSGHSVLVGKVVRSWQDRERVLSQFGGTEKSAVEAYCRYLEEGVPMGRRPELVGGGLVRSAGGWSHIKSRLQSSEKELSDERILGCGEFVERVVSEAEEKIRLQFPIASRGEQAKGIIEEVCAEKDVTLQELQSGSRRGPVSTLRKRLTRQLVRELGLSQADAARLLGVTAAAVAKSLGRQE